MKAGGCVPVLSMCSPNMGRSQHGGGHTSLVMCSLSRRMSTSCSLAAMGHAARSTRPAMQMHACCSVPGSSLTKYQATVRSWGQSPGVMVLHASAKSRALTIEASRAVAREVGTV